MFVEEKRMGWGEKEREKRKKNEDLGGGKNNMQRKREEEMCSSVPDFKDFGLLIWGFLTDGELNINIFVGVFIC